jgi:hypothetical protein
MEVYGVMTGTDPDSGEDIIGEQSVDLFDESGGGGSSCGLTTSFIRPSSWPPAG